MGQKQATLVVNDARFSLKPGDHIYSDRMGHLYYHHVQVFLCRITCHAELRNFASGRSDSFKRDWTAAVCNGIYMGNDMVIHLQGPTKEREMDSFPPCPKCGYKRHSNGGLIKTCLDCFLSGHSLYVYEYGVSIIQWSIKLRGSCSPIASRPPEEVIKVATVLLEGKGFSNYNFIANNCEDFAVYCKTGMPLSMQALGGSERVFGVPGWALYLGQKIIHNETTIKKNNA